MISRKGFPIGISSVQITTGGFEVTDKSLKIAGDHSTISLFQHIKIWVGVIARSNPYPSHGHLQSSSTTFWLAQALIVFPAFSVNNTVFDHPS